jgi:hypothetical protein
MKDCKKGFIPPGLKPNELNEKKRVRNSLKFINKAFRKI